MHTLVIHMHASVLHMHASIIHMHASVIHMHTSVLHMHTSVIHMHTLGSTHVLDRQWGSGPTTGGVRIFGRGGALVGNGQR
jgi:hypothetical protein